MKKINLSILLCLILTVSSCSSDDADSNENSMAKDIVGEWSPVGFCNLHFIFYSDGSFEYDSTSWDYSGRYNITNGNTLEIISESNDGMSHRVTIEKLTSDEMVWKYIRDGEVKSFVRGEDCTF